MHRFIGLISRFKRDERGAFAVMFGLMAIVLIAISGAVVDYVTLEQTRNRAQIALDAAALALQPEIFEDTYTQDELKLMAQDLMLNRIGDDWNVVASVIEVDPDPVEGSLYFRARMTVPTLFLTLVGVDELSAQIQSEATRKKLALEVAFVLDNSGSMSFTGAGANGTRQRIQFLRDAAKCATNILFYDEVVDDPANSETCIPATGAELIENVRVAVVPFTMFVNVGASNSSATWLDQNGASVISNDNFDNDDDETTMPTGLPDRFDLFTATGEAWRGCVEARPHIASGSTATEYLDTDDTLATGGNTLYVPLFSPDMVNGVGGNTYVSDSPAVCDRPPVGNTNCVMTQQRTCNKKGCGSATTTTTEVRGPTNYANSALYSGAWYGANAPSCSCRNYSYSTWTGTGTETRTVTCTGGGYVPGGLSTRELQERICKYHQTGTTGFSRGPNADCTRTAILPLSDSPTTVNTTITGMRAEGGTNIHEGTAWGYRVLSPDLPFTEGDDYVSATSKVMIVMTDGENTAYDLASPLYPDEGHCLPAQTALNGSCYNSAYGFPYNSKNNNAGSSSSGIIERLGPAEPSPDGSIASTNAELVSQMNSRTYQTCENAKAAGITVYVIGLATSQAQQSTRAVVEAMLTQCASSPDHAFFPQEPADLKAVFEDIADDLSALRLAL